MENTSLLKQLVNNAGLTEAAAIKALSTIAGFAKEKYPILEGSINSYLKEEFKQANPGLISPVLGNS
jgi:hypothetical protein